MTKDQRIAVARSEIVDLVDAMNFLVEKLQILSLALMAPKGEIDVRLDAIVGFTLDQYSDAKRIAEKADMLGQ